MNSFYFMTVWEEKQSYKKKNHKRGEKIKINKEGNETILSSYCLFVV